MSPTCSAFRLLLERRLTGRATRERLSDLAWHEHLFACADCRALLEDEEALESLLASLPEPRLAPAVRQRVLARLRFAREEDLLDRVLDRAASDPPPANLAVGVLAGLARRRAEDRLDRLLDRDEVEVPAGLSARTLASLRLARRPRRVALRFVAVAAAAAALAAITWIAWPRRAETGRSSVELAQGAGADVRPIAPTTSTPVSDDDVVQALDVLENWDVLVSDDVETMLGTLPADEAATLDGFEEEG